LTRYLRHCERSEAIQEPLRLLNGFVALVTIAMALFAVFCSCAPALAADPSFPPLSGRVVDQANVLSPDTRSALTNKLKDLDEKSGIQLVVATVSSLEGLEIEPYANQLFRAWRLGEQKKNNGVLFLIAPNEHKVRIEVGYGLEGTLTDAISKIIIVNAVAPRFKAGDFNSGVTRGVDDIITTLTTDSSEWQKRPAFRPQEQTNLVGVLIPILFIAIFLFIFIVNVRQQGGVGRALLYMWMTSGSSGDRSSDGFSSSGFSGGGGSFSGGGGSSGGGGASGSW
jgi:uncharacterized protein